MSIFPRPGDQDGPAWRVPLPEIPAEVFISYSRTREPQAAQIETALAQFGFTVFRDRTELNVGDAYPRRLQEAVEAAGAVVVLLTKTALKSAWVQKEIEWGAARGTLLPCLLEPIDESQLPPMLQGVHFSSPITMNSGRMFLVGLFELAKALGKKLGRPALHAIASHRLDEIRPQWVRDEREYHDEHGTVRLSLSHVPLPVEQLEVLKAEFSDVLKTRELKRILWFKKERAAGTPLEFDVTEWIASYAGALLSEVRDEVRALEGAQLSSDGFSKLMLAAELGDVNAIHLAALVFYNGLYGTRDMKKARHYLSMGASRGDIECIKYLAPILLSGDGGERSLAEGVDWLRLAAGDGHGDSCCRLAIMYQKGLVKEQTSSEDISAAKFWYVKAARGGNVIAKANLASILANGCDTSRELAFELMMEVAKFAIKSPSAPDAHRAVMAGPILRSWIQEGRGTLAMRQEALKYINQLD